MENLSENKIYLCRESLGSELLDLSNRLSLPIKAETDEPAGLFLHKENNALSLKLSGERGMSISVDFTSASSTHRRQQGGGKQQPIGKAVGLNKTPNPVVLDATAGLGRDAFLLSTYGCDVILVEQNTVVIELLKDGLRRLQESLALSEIAARMTLIASDSIQYMQSIELLSRPPDVVYLDPMFPERKKSAKVKKEMQMLQMLLGHQVDENAMLDAALACATGRVVVKRPKSAPALSGRVVDHIIESKKMRYDVYMCSTKMV